MTQDKVQIKENIQNHALQTKFNQRITIAKEGREFFLRKDYVKATKKYTEYLNILAEVHSLDNIFELSPKKFRSKEDLTEMLLVSQIFWELSRVYEMTPKLQQAYEKCLKQFVRFTINQPYQVLNSEMLRKYIKKHKRNLRQVKALQEAYAQIQTESKKCIISTYALTETHWITQELRQFKKSFLVNSKIGLILVDHYYRASSSLVKYLETHKLIAKKFRPLLALTLYSLGYIIRGVNLLGRK